MIASSSCMRGGNCKNVMHLLGVRLPSTPPSLGAARLRDGAPHRGNDDSRRTYEDRYFWVQFTARSLRTGLEFAVNEPARAALHGGGNEVAK